MEHERNDVKHGGSVMSPDPGSREFEILVHHIKNPSKDRFFIWWGS